jgi:succinoglycan biosynthesis transport protein ExoP
VEKPRIDNLDHLAILRGIARRHKGRVVGIFLGIALPGLALISLTGQPQYVSTATIAIEPSAVQQVLKDIPRNDNVAVNMVLLKSRSLGEGVLEALPKESFEELLANSQYTDYRLVLTNTIKGWLGKPPTVLSPKDRAIAELQNARMSFSRSGEDRSIISISAVASKPRVAMDMVNTHVQILLSRTRNANQEDTRTVRDFLEQQTQQLKESLAKAENGLVAFQQQKGRFGVGGVTDRELALVSETENALAEAQASREALGAQITSLRQELGKLGTNEPKTAAEPQARGKDPAAARAAAAEIVAKLNSYKVAQDRATKLEAKLSSLRDRYTDAHPLVQSTQEQLAAAQAQLTQLARDLPDLNPRERAPARSKYAEAKGELESLEAEDATLRETVERLKVRVSKLRGNLRNLTREDVELKNLHQTVETQRNLLTVMSDKLMAARIREQVEPGVIRIIDPASYPLQSTQSRTGKLALMVLGLAGAVAVGAAFGIEFWRQPVETESDVQKATGLPILGSISPLPAPVVHANGRGGNNLAALPVAFVGSPASTRIPSELYRMVRATVETERLKTPFRSILVTSAGPGEGKSTTVINLARTFQDFGRRVLIVEADLRRPLLYRTLGVTNKPGLEDFLAGSATFEQVCRELPSGVTLIPGQHTRGDSASLLACPRAKELMRQAVARFDLILVDSPPLLVVPDNLLLVTLLDRVILVAKASHTSKRDLQRAKAALDQTNAAILGVVLNQASPRDLHYYRSRYKKYYYQVPETKTQPEASRRP